MAKISRRSALAFSGASGRKPTTSAPEIPTVVQLGYPKISILGWYFFCTSPRTRRR